MRRKKTEERFVFPGVFGMENPITPLIKTDPLGSYTGFTDDPNEAPVQNADDL